MAVNNYELLSPDRAAYTSATPGQYGGNRRSHIFGLLDCPAALRAIQRGGYIKNRVFFADTETAAAAGYRPCGACLPDAYRVWKESSPSIQPP